MAVQQFVFTIPQEHCTQGLDTNQEQILQPKVVEALLGTRFRGREYSRGPLVRGVTANGLCVSILCTLLCTQVHFICAPLEQCLKYTHTSNHTHYTTTHTQ